MGLISPKPITTQPGQALAIAIQNRCREAITRGGEASPHEIAALMGPALADVQQQDATLLYLAAFLGRCMSGSVPDPQVWLPFL
jgi:hypothetical protein